VKFQFIKDHREHFPVRPMCRVLDASPSGFYDWLRRPEGPRAAEDRVLVEKIQAVYSESRRTYGSPRVHASLKAEGYRIGRKREQRIRCSADARERHPGPRPSASSGSPRQPPRSPGRAQFAGPTVHGRGARHGVAGGAFRSYGACSGRDD